MLNTSIFYKDTPYECIVYYKDNDKRIAHREDGPAVEWVNGDKEWWINSKRHRIDGPAVEFANGKKYFYLNGQSFLEKEYWTIIKLGAFI